jgi:putative tryptophan/tyrosine transport system substrate-binding protein
VNILAAKRLELLHELVPQTTVIGYLRNPTSSPVYVDAELQAVQVAAGVRGVRILSLMASTPAEIDVAFKQLVQEHAGALLSSSDPYFAYSQRGQILDLSARYRIPTIYAQRDMAAAGCLMSYGVTTRTPSTVLGSTLREYSKAKSAPTFRSNGQQNRVGHQP